MNNFLDISLKKIEIADLFDVSRDAIILLPTIHEPLAMLTETEISKRDYVENNSGKFFQLNACKIVNAQYTPYILVESTMFSGQKTEEEFLKKAYRHAFPSRHQYDISSAFTGKNAHQERATFIHNLEEASPSIHISEETFFCGSIEAQMVFTNNFDSMYRL